MTLQNRLIEAVPSAFPVHGYARATLDIDIFIEATPLNATRTLAALSDRRSATRIGLKDARLNLQ